MIDSLAILIWLTSSLTSSACTLDHPHLVTLESYGVQLEFYDIEGQTEEELYHSMMANGPRDSGGEPRDASFSWRFDAGPDTTNSSLSLIEELSSGGTISRRLKTKLVLPCFRGLQKASNDLQASWVNFINRLISHETRHAIHFFRALPKLEYAISTGSEDLFWREIANLKRQDREYDHQTRHGATEGARLGSSCS